MTETGMTAFLRQLQTVPDIGQFVSKSVYDFFHDPTVLAQIEQLRQIGLNFTQPQKQTVSRALEGKVVVFTGEIQGLTRSEAQQLAALHGAKTSSTVSAKTSLVVAAKAAGTKLKKAQALGVPVITPEEFFEMIGRTF